MKDTNLYEVRRAHDEIVILCTDLMSIIEGDPEDPPETHSAADPLLMSAVEKLGEAAEVVRQALGAHEQEKYMVKWQKALGGRMSKASRNPPWYGVTGAQGSLISPWEVPAQHLTDPSGSAGEDTDTSGHVGVKV